MSVPPDQRESSLLWGGSSTGDAPDFAPYDYTWFMTYLTMMARLVSTTKYGVLATDHAQYSGNLAPTNPAGTTLRVASGAAIIYRVLYLNDANVDFNLSHEGYYTVVLRLNRSQQTVRLSLLGYTPGSYPSPSRTYGVHDIVIAYVYSSGATLTITDMRRFARNLTAYTHSGDSNFWWWPTGASQRVRGMMIEAGSVPPKYTTMMTSTSATFPRKYSTGTAPIMFFQAVGVPDTKPTTTKLFSKTADRNWISYYIESTGNLSAIWYMAFGVLA